jgi:hypothetical protein
MRALAASAALVLLAACSANTLVRSDAGPALTPPPGVSVSRGAVGVDSRGGSGVAALLTLGVIAAALHGAPLGPEARLSESRRVNAQDCTRPIEDSSANLSCR